MSVPTDADSAVDEAMIRINDSIQKLSQIIVENCPGAEDFSKEYKLKINEAFFGLINIRDKLK